MAGHTTLSVAYMTKSLDDKRKTKGKTGKVRKSNGGQEGPCSAGKKETVKDSSRGRYQVNPETSKT